MSENLPTPTPQEESFSCKIQKNEKSFTLNLEFQNDLLIIALSDNCSNKLFQTTYKETFTFDSLLKVHKFFHQYENVIEVFSAIKNVIETGSYKLEEGEKEIFLIFFCFGREVKINVPEKPKTDNEMIIIISDCLFTLKENFLKKIKELEEINKNFYEIKKKNEELIKENKKITESKKKLIKENKHLQEIIKNLKETRVETLNTKIETLLNNSSKVDGKKLREKILGGYKGKLEGDLLNENTIAFDELCKAYLWYWMSNDENSKINTVLLYKGTRDGDRSSTFHSKCDNKGLTLTLVKTTTNFHFGGFARANWNTSNSYIKSQGDFIFTLDKKLKYPLKSHEYHIYGNLSYGPTFGGGHDFYISDLCMNNESSYSNTPYSYNVTDILAGSYNFKVAEIEVYQVNFQ